MKTKLFLLSMIILFCSTSAFAQRKHYRQHSNHRSLLSYVFNAGHSHHGVRHNTYRYDYRRTDYDRYDRYYDRMSRRDQRCLRDLIDKLEERKRCAWEDGYITDREDRRIYAVEQDIEDLLYKYRRTERYYDRRGRNSNPRCR